MEIYYFYNTFPLFRFNQYKDHNLNSIKEYDISLLSGFINKKFFIEDQSGKILFTETGIDFMLNKAAKMRGYDLLNFLITVYPTIPFFEERIDVWKILKNSFSNLLVETDKVLLKSAINFKLDINFVENELKRLSSVYGFKVNMKQTFKELFVSYYKYCFVLFCKSIDFKFGGGENRKAPFEKEFIFDFKKFNREVIKNSDKLNNPNIQAKSYVLAEIYIGNFYQSANLYTEEEASDFLKELLSFNSPKQAERNIYDAFINNIIPNKDITSKKFNKELRELFLKINKPLFHNQDDPNTDVERLRDLQKHLKYRK